MTEIFLYGFDVVSALDCRLIGVAPIKDRRYGYCTRSSPI